MFVRDSLSFMYKIWFKRVQKAIQFYGRGIQQQNIVLIELCESSFVLFFLPQSEMTKERENEPAFNETDRG